MNIQEQIDLTANQPANESKRHTLKHILMGSPEAVKSAIYYYELKGQADIAHWSPLQPNPGNPEEVMSILVRKITVR